MGRHNGDGDVAAGLVLAGVSGAQVCYMEKGHMAD